MQIIAQPLPCIDLRDRQAGLPIRQRQEEPPAPNDHRDNGTTRSPRVKQTLAPESLVRGLERATGLLGHFRFQFFLLGGEGRVVVELGEGVGVEDEFDEGAGDEGGGQVGGQVVM